MNDTSPDRSQLEVLTARLEEARKKATAARYIRRTTIFLGLIIPLVTPVAVFSFLANASYDRASSIAIAAGAAALAVLISVMTTALVPVELAEREVNEIQDELDLQQMASASAEQKAHKLLKIQQGQLSRYLDVILQQSKAIFVMGILAMLVGVGVVLIAIWQTRQISADAVAEKTIVAVLGAVGSILTNFVGAVYLRMFGDIGQAVQRSVGTLAQALNMNFANVIISNISKEEIQDEARKDLVAKLGPTS